ncbi:PAS domain-containing protein [Erythrobacter sp. NFXS35]|uniref:PAS domain-containing protein n=1 Tax=Erythrobacter sp. NFXS35 TaxID=2818436 RepID=UPI0032DF1D15
MRQRALADFGDFVLEHDDLDAILTEGCRLISKALGTDLAKVIEIEAETGTGLVRAGIGWNEGIVGKERVSLAEQSSEAFAVKTAKPVICNDISDETRFHFPKFLRAHGVVALINVPIFLPGRTPWGILQVDARRPRDFDGDDIDFLKTYAMTLGPVIDRLRVVAERDDIRKEVLQRDERLHHIIDAMGEGFGVLAPDFTILEHNREAARMDGRLREEIVGRSHWEAYPGTEDAEVGRVLKQAMAEQTPATLEHFITLPTGSLWLEMRAYPVDNGCLAVFWRDVTQRRAAIDALRESEARLIATFESVPAAIAAIDRSGKAVLANQRYLRLIPSGMLPSRDLEAFARWRGWDDEGRPLKPEEYPGARALRGEIVLPGQELLHTDENGVETWFRVANVPTRDAQGDVTGLVTVITDISESKAVEAALRASEGRLQTLIEGIPQLVWRAAPDGSWTWASPQWEKFTGLPREASRGDSWLAALHPDDRGAARQAWAEATATQRLAFDCRVHDVAAGEYRWFQTRALPVHHAGGTIREWLGTCTDVHDLRQLQERQRVLVGELQHRTRNLIGVINAMCDRTARSSRDFDEFRAKYRDRLDAMARVQGLLSRLSPDDRITFDELIETELAALDGDETAGKVTMTGPRGVRLRSSTVQTLAMALHELTTNALKHGALGQDGARLEVDWALEQQAKGKPGEKEPWLRIAWRETGVRMQDGESKGSGQGRELIEKSLPFQLGARTAYELGPDGVDCTIWIPVSKQHEATGVGG